LKKLSIVATSRNDDHGGNLLHRTQLFVSGLIAQCNRHNLDAELILVEWNPPSDRPRLSEVLQWPIDTGLCDIRIIEVPEAVHRRFQHSENLPLFQMIAKNVGIRRARGEFILATNIDILFSDELMKFISEGYLKPGRTYRIDRYDVYGDIPLDMPFNQQLEYCRNHILRVNHRKYSRNLITGQINNIYKSANLCQYIPTCWKYWLNERKSKRLDPLWTLKYIKYVVEHWFKLLIEKGPLQLHTNACGDFTLMDAGSWHAIKGYWEWEGYSMHLDSHLLFVAHHAGVPETVLNEPMRIYHIEHGTGSGYTPEGKKILYQRIENAGIPILDSNLVFNWAIQMRREHRAIIFNNENWGLIDEDLPETRIGKE